MLIKPFWGPMINREFELQHLPFKHAKHQAPIRSYLWNDLEKVDSLFVRFFPGITNDLHDPVHRKSSFWYTRC